MSIFTFIVLVFMGAGAYVGLAVADSPWYGAGCGLLAFIVLLLWLSREPGT